MSAVPPTDVGRPSESEPASTPAVERQIVHDMVRRALPLLPLIVVVSGIVWGINGALSAAFAVGLVVLNFFASAALLSWAASISPMALMVTALTGFLVRLALVTAAIFAVKDQAWVEMVPLAITILVTHLGLLIWEMRHVSTSLAFPALLPKRGA